MFRGKPVIGVTPLYDKDRDSYWMLPGYMKALEEQGAITMMLPMAEDESDLDFFLEVCDGFLLTGGQDIDPSVYGEENTKCGELSPMRDKVDIHVLTRAIERDKPVLGICRGFQLMNAVYGGTLYQDIPSQFGTDLQHSTTQAGISSHTVSVIPETPFAEALGTNEFTVNSYHHQGIKDLSPEFAAMAKAPDGLVEAIYMTGRNFVWGVQWHPEFTYKTQAQSKKIMEAFVKAAKAEN